MTTYWAPLLHIYQPPTQDIGILRKIDKECYKPLFSILEDHDNAKFTLNINGILIEMLREFDLEDTIEQVQTLVADQKLEIMGTANFHPILPLIPKKEVFHQIQMNENINRNVFGNFWKRKGFFPPEMAISSKIAKYIKEISYEWVIQSGIAFPGEDKSLPWPYDIIYKSPNGLKLIFRDDILSNKISFKKITAKEFTKQLKSVHKDEKNHYKNNTYIVTAMDGETFGHHIKNYERTFIGKVLELINDDEEIEITFISLLDQYFPFSDMKIIPKESSWSTTENDIQQNLPYPLWNNSDNKIHKYYWKIVKSLNKLMNLVDTLDLTKEWNIQNYYNTARWFYDRSICSDTTWWANPERGSWSPNMIYKGVVLLMKAALNAHLALINANRDDGEGYYDSISYYHGLLMMEISVFAQKNV
ncbi:MAG: hypothetical protein ACTSV5_09885 [Promethearchaeota archaeon]